MIFRWSLDLNLCNECGLSLYLTSDYPQHPNTWSSSCSVMYIWISVKLMNNPITAMILSFICMPAFCPYCDQISLYRASEHGSSCSTAWMYFSFCCSSLPHKKWWRRSSSLENIFLSQRSEQRSCGWWFVLYWGGFLKSNQAESSVGVLIQDFNL